MYNKIYRQKFYKKVRTSNFINFFSIYKPKDKILSYLFSFNAFIVGISAFFIITFISFLIMLASYSSSNRNIYEIQKAELFYRELEANLQYDNGVIINHDPIDLSSFLSIIFGDFIFDEEMETFLTEEVF